MLQLLRRMGRRRVAMLLAVMGATIVCVGMVQLHLLMTTSSGGSAGDASNANNCLPCSSHLQMQQQQQLPVGATADSSDVAFEAAMCPKPVSTGPKPRPARSLAIILLPEAFADMATALAAVSSSEELATRASSSSSSAGSSLQSRPPGFSKAFESVDELRRHRKLAQVHSRNKQKELATSGMMRANSSADVIPVPPQSTSSDDLQLLPFTLLGFELGEQLPYPLYLPRPSKQQLNNRVKDKRDAFVQVLADGIRAEMRKSLGPLSIQFIGLVPHDSPIDAMELQDTFTAAYLEAEPAMAQSLAGDDKARARGQAAAAASAAARASGKSVSDSTKAGAEAARALGPVTAKDLDPLDRVPVTLRIVKMPATSKRLELQRKAREFMHWHSSNRGSAATASPEWRLLSQLPQVDVRDALEAALPVTTANYVTWVNSNQLLFFNFSSILTSTLVEYSEADVAYAFGVPQEDDAGGREGFEESTMTSISCFPFATCRTTDQVAFAMNTTCARAVIADQATGDMQSSWHGEVFVWQRVRELCRPLVHVPGTVMTQRTDQQRTDELLQSIQVDDPSIKPPEKQARLAQLVAKQAEFTRNVIAIAMRKALIPLNDDMYHVWGDMSAFLSPALGFTIDRAAAEMQIQLETGLRLWNSGVAASVTSSAPGTTADSGSSSSNNNNNNNNNAVDDVCWRFRDCYVGDQVIDDSPAGQTAAQKSATDARRFVSNLCGMALALCQADNKAPLLAKSTLSLVESSVLHSGSGLDWVPFDLAQTAVAMAVSVAAMTPGDAAAFGVPVAAGRQASSSTPADAVAAVLAAVSSIESALRSTELSRRNRLYAMSYVRPPTEILAPPRKRVLAVIPSDPLRAYEDKGRAALLENYYNPAGFFDEVYLLSPLETVERYQYGMHIIPTLPHDIPSRLIQYKVDIVRAYGGYWASDAAVYNSLPGVKVVVSIHDSNPRLLHSSIAQADYVMTVSRALDSILTQRGVNPDRIFPYSNSVDLAVFNPQPESGRAAFEAKYPGFKYRILHVGRKTAQKNGDTLLKAMQILGPDYMLIMIGSSTSDANFFASLQDLVAQEGLQKRVVMLDGVENSELVNFYSFTDVFCTPSRWEGFGVVFVEALAAGAVVVTSDMSPVNEIIKHEENGYLVRDYTNPQALASALEYAATNAAFRDKMKINGPRTVRRFAEPRQRLAEAAIYRMIYESDIPVRPPVQRPPGQFDIQLGFKNYLMGFSFLDPITLSSSVCVSSRLSLSSGDMMCDGVHAMPNAAKLPWHPRTAYDLALPVHAVPLEIFEHIDSLLRWPITTAVAEDIDLAFEPFVVPTM
ncbi:hypothetical protein CAOG_05874 [Capsaspora owczarzaki ATCC 30864]|uniref:hypothetical protein n=1 Tax=Capsaspora owczarzaki (strain ATCC 30864) TaxID=595528 RepID=UPI0003526A4A|nr:hypothetical protein CAOG_05874 [Capsaspora owczarzaki ATCC 30864]|eukprot:XP_004345464.2 hypothetical protein CAOG_05874 [Capsaspora owczarzaki ATCC 30864]